MKALVGTMNPGKLEGAYKALKCYYDEAEVSGIKVPSNVNDQPVNDEIYQGALNRVNNLIEYAKQNNIESELFMAVESGISNQLGKWMIINIAVIKDNNGNESWGSAAGIPVPQKYVQRIIDTDFGTVMDEMFDGHELSKGKGGVSFLTNNSISRIDMTQQAFTTALTQFANSKVWSDFILVRK